MLNAAFILPILDSMTGSSNCYENILLEELDLIMIKTIGEHELDGC